MTLSTLLRQTSARLSDLAGLRDRLRLSQLVVDSANPGWQGYRAELFFGQFPLDQRALMGYASELMSLKSRVDAIVAAASPPPLAPGRPGSVC